MQAHTRIAVAGATGRLGRQVVEVLTGGGHDVPTEFFVTSARNLHAAGDRTL